MTIGQTVRLIVTKTNTLIYSIGRITHIYREGVYEVEFRVGLDHLSSETCTQNEIEKY